MSIAISVVVRPSKIGSVCAIVFALFLLLIAIQVACLQHLSIITRCTLVLLCCLPAWQGYSYGKKIATTSWRIIVDGNGQLRCMEMVGEHDTAPLFAQKPSLLASQSEFPCDARLLNLATGTTLWPHVLFLRLQDPENAATKNVVVMPDALSRDEYRRLSIACRWIVNHMQ